MWRSVAILAVGLHLSAGAVRSQEVGREPAPTDAIRALLAQYCVQCHGPKVQKAKLRLDTLAADFSGETRETWAGVLERVANGEMPPKERPRVPPHDLERLTGWITHHLQTADAARRQKEGRTVLRRLNRQEYQNSVRDLFGVAVNVKDTLPEDATKYGFDNVGSALSVSSILLERYLEAADTVLDQVLTQYKKPPSETRKFAFKNERVREITTLTRVVPDGLVLFSSYYPPAILLSFKVPAPGEPPRAPGRARLPEPGTGHVSRLRRPAVRRLGPEAPGGLLRRLT